MTTEQLRSLKPAIDYYLNYFEPVTPEEVVEKDRIRQLYDYLFVPKEMY